VRKILALPAAGLFVLTALAVASPKPGHAPRLLLQDRSLGHTELALWNTPISALLERVDPRTLQRRGRPLRLGRHAYFADFDFSPDGSQIVLFGPEARLLIVNVRRLRLLPEIRVYAEGDVIAAAWVGGRILAASQYLGRITFFSVDPATRRIAVGRAIQGSIQDAAEVASGLVLVVSPPDSIGPSRLVVFAENGTLRTAGIDRIDSGAEPFDEQTTNVVHHARPGLAIDRESNRAFVVGAGAPVAAVDLRTMAVAYHDLSTPVSLLGRLHDWFEPAAAAKGLAEGPTRRAAWLGNGALAVWGWDDRAAPGERALMSQEPAGLSLVDTRDWSIRRLDPGATSVVVANGRLLAFAWLRTSGGSRPSGMGLTAYGPDGAARFHVLGSQPVLSVQTSGDRAFVRGVKSSYSVLDLRSGRFVRSFRGEMPQLLLP
jgi:hypothetical protein